MVDASSPCRTTRIGHPQPCMMAHLGPGEFIAPQVRLDRGTLHRYFQYAELSFAGGGRRGQAPSVLPTAPTFINRCWPPSEVLQDALIPIRLRRRVHQLLREGGTDFTVPAFPLCLGQVEGRRRGGPGAPRLARPDIPPQSVRAESRDRPTVNFVLPGITARPRRIATTSTREHSAHHRDGLRSPCCSRSSRRLHIDTKSAARFPGATLRRRAPAHHAGLSTPPHRVFFLDGSRRAQHARPAHPSEESTPRQPRNSAGASIFDTKCVARPSNHASARSALIESRNEDPSTRSSTAAPPSSLAERKGNPS